MSGDEHGNQQHQQYTQEQYEDDSRLDHGLWVKGPYGWIHPDRVGQFWHETDRSWYYSAQWERSIRQAQLEAQKIMAQVCYFLKMFASFISSLYR